MSAGDSVLKRLFKRRKFLQATALMAMVVAGGWLAFPKTANADADPQADIIELQGTTTPGAGSIDPRVANVAQLKKPPLSAYNTYKLLNRATFPVKKGVPSSYTLKNGRILQLTFEDMSKDNRYRVLTTISEPNGKDFLSRLEVLHGANELLAVAGQWLDPKHHDKGALVLGITIHP
ncbi:MAG: hypothetical protein ABI183_22615 [Polyangiaceae bacterium]